jgi:hypothetical protein
MNEDQNIINHSEGKYFDGEKSVLNEKELEELKGITFKSGAVYEGEWIGHVRDGFGIQRWPDGARYEG